ncbi:MAG: ABC transporter substrate-binding protein [Streptomyces sp.]|uniref:ABC transporter substrate-binding protein n=1 Tax=Streptomyces sp. TaxID=1931 RepID=UPI003D6BFF6E
MPSTPRPLTTAAVAAGAAALLLVSACGGPSGPKEVDLGSGPAKAGAVKKGALKGVDLTFTSYGGFYQDGQEKAAIDSFSKASGAKVLQDGPTDYAKLQAQVKSRNVTWDVVDTDGIWSGAHCGDLLQPLDYKVIDKSKVPEGMATKCSVPAMEYGVVLVYDKKKYGAKPPQGWQDFFDTKKFPGKRAIPGIPGDASPGPMEAALTADGVAADELYPLDEDRALKKLSSVRSDTVFWKTGAEAQQLLESGEVDMAMMWTGRAYAAVKNGAPYAAQWNQWLPVMDTLSVPKGAKNPKASMALINHYLGAKQQEKLTELTSYSPVNTDADPKLDKLGASYLTTRPGLKKKALPVDPAWWSKHQKAMTEKWAAWLGA